jgi:hypothetical protein
VVDDGNAIAELVGLLHVVGREQDRLAVTVELAEEKGHPVTDLSITEPTLETVFIKLTGKDLRE